VVKRGGIRKGQDLHTIDLRSLRAFLCVEESGSVSGAARTLGCSQPTVSNRIRALEGHLGVELFTRSELGMRPTPAGRALVPYARRVFSLLTHTRHAVARGAGPGGELRIGTTATFAVSGLGSVLTAFRSQNPSVEVSLRTGSSEALIADVLCDRIDVAFVESRTHDPELVCAQWREEEMVLAIPPQRGNRLIDTVLIFQEGCPYRTVVDAWLDDLDYPPTSMLEVRGLEAMIASLESGVGGTLLPRSIAEHYSPRIGFTAVDPTRYRSACNIVYRSVNQDWPAIVALHSLLKRRETEL
jgi:DNA-binding transcriptional LysR family regulator